MIRLIAMLAAVLVLFAGCGQADNSSESEPDIVPVGGECDLQYSESVDAFKGELLEDVGFGPAKIKVTESLGIHDGMFKEGDVVSLDLKPWVQRYDHEGKMALTELELLFKKGQPVIAEYTFDDVEYSKDSEGNLYITAKDGTPYSYSFSYNGDAPTDEQMSAYCDSNGDAIMLTEQEYREYKQKKDK